MSVEDDVVTVDWPGLVPRNALNRMLWHFLFAAWNLAFFSTLAGKTDFAPLVVSGSGIDG